MNLRSNKLIFKFWWQIEAKKEMLYRLIYITTNCFLQFDYIDTWINIKHASILRKKDVYCGHKVVCNIPWHGDEMWWTESFSTPWHWCCNPSWTPLTLPVQSASPSPPDQSLGRNYWSSWDTGREMWLVEMYIHSCHCNLAPMNNSHNFPYFCDHMLHAYIRFGIHCAGCFCDSSASYSHIDCDTNCSLWSYDYAGSHSDRNYWTHYNRDNYCSRPDGGDGWGNFGGSDNRGSNCSGSKTVREECGPQTATAPPGTAAAATWGHGDSLCCPSKTCPQHSVSSLTMLHVHLCH